MRGPRVYLTYLPAPDHNAMNETHGLTCCKCANYDSELEELSILNVYERGLLAYLAGGSIIVVIGDNTETRGYSSDLKLLPPFIPVLSSYGSRG